MPPQDSRPSRVMQLPEPVLPTWIAPIPPVDVFDEPPAVGVQLSVPNSATQLLEPVLPSCPTRMPPVDVLELPPEEVEDVPAHWDELSRALTQFDDRVLPSCTAPMLPVLELSDVEVGPPDPLVPVVGAEPAH